MKMGLPGEMRPTQMRSCAVMRAIGRSYPW